MRIAELKNKRAALLAQAEEINKRSTDALTNEEHAQIDAIMADAVQLRGQIETLEALQNAQREIVAAESHIADNSNHNDSHKRAWLEYMRTGNTRALNTTDDAALVPQDTLNRIYSNLQAQNFYRTLSAAAGNVLNLKTDAKFPYVGDVTANLTSEASEIAATEPTVTPVLLDAYSLTCTAQFSTHIESDSPFDMEDTLVKIFASAFNRRERALFTTGTGTGQPQGVMAGAGTGVTSASTTTFTITDLFSLYHSVPQEYRNQPGCGWVMSDTTLLAIRKMRDNAVSDGDSEGNLLFFNPNTASTVGMDMLLGKPVYVAPTAASTTGNAVVFFGDISQLIIADRRGIRTQRLNELYAINLMSGVLAEKRVDSRYPNSNAGKKLVLA